MKKSLYLFLSFIFIFLSVGCKKDETFSLNFSDINSDDNYVKIYEFSDGRKVYSKFADINYVKENGKKIKLVRALKQNRVTIEDIISKMIIVDDALEWNDRWSRVYKYEVNGDNFSNVSFFLMQCSMPMGRNDIIFGDSLDVINECFPQ